MAEESTQRTVYMPFASLRCGSITCKIYKTTNKENKFRVTFARDVPGHVPEDHAAQEAILFEPEEIPAVQKLSEEATQLVMQYQSVVLSEVDLKGESESEGDDEQ